MKIVIATLVGLGCGLGCALVATAGLAAHKPSAPQAAGKPAPTCAALVFRPLPTGTADGEQAAGMYKSRLARLELRGSVKDGAAANYYLVANGSQLAAAQTPPPAAGDCAAAKKMPRPGAAAGACTGDKFTVVVAHAADKRFALLYAQSGGNWTFCNAGSF